MQVRRTAIDESSARSGIAFEDQPDASDTVQATPAARPLIEHRAPTTPAEAALLDALDALSFSLTGKPPADVIAPAAELEDALPEPTFKPPPAASTAAPLAQAACEGTTKRRGERLANIHVARGVLYWLAVGIAGGSAWWSASSLYQAAVAALIASGAVMTVEIVLRAIDPAIARRLGLDRRRASLASSPAVRSSRY